MNKKVEIKKNMIVLFVINILVLLTLILFKVLFTSISYYSLLVNGMLIVNIIVLIAGIIFNVLMLKEPDKYDEKKSIIVFVSCFIIYLLINTLGIYLINKPYEAKFSKISSELSSYCSSYGCDRYETYKEGKYEVFVIKKMYFDFDKAQNELEIHTKYDTKGVVSVKAVVYSRKQSYSESLIKNQLKDYYSNFNYDIKEQKITEAFEKRFTTNVKDGNVTYKVKEIYKKKELDKLKTEITLTVK